jgi:hypothetical protein
VPTYRTVEPLTAEEMSSRDGFKARLRVDQLLILGITLAIAGGLAAVASAASSSAAVSSSRSSPRRRATQWRSSD